MNVAELVEGALRKIGVMDAGDVVPAATKMVGLTALNRMLSAWSLERNLNVVSTDTKTLTSGVAFYSIGPTGDIVTVRPSKVVAAYLTKDSTDYTLQRISLEDYYALPDKAAAGIPTRYVYDPQSPDATIYLYPTPENADTLKFISQKPLAQYISLSDTVNLPVEYHAAIEWNLAVMLAPEFGQSPSEVVVAMAQSTYDSLASAIRQVVPIAATTPFIRSRYYWM